jgi:hypothetical protein
MGLPKGDRYTQNLTVPDWVNGEVFLSEFLGGLFDTAKDVDLKRHRIYIRQTSHQDNRKAFTGYIKNVASLLRELGIDLTKKGERVYDIKGSLVGLIRLPWKNRRATKRKLRTKFESSERVLGAA